MSKAGVRRRRSLIRVLPHTSGSLLIQPGESLTYVRDQMGHASIQITVDEYGHLVPGAGTAKPLIGSTAAHPEASQAHPTMDCRMRSEA